MSMDAYRWAISWTGLKSSTKFVLVSIADHYNERAHRSWPSQQRIELETALSHSTVNRALDELEKEGLIEREPWVMFGTFSKLNTRYCLPMHDPKSRRAATLPVLVHKQFNNEGSIEYDTFPHHFATGEVVPSYGI
ncbi:helix-turn-helix domain-containing protein [Microbacterium sp.]|uniref:helix-turn-helix domain-containing protein n=1 Tax=Microbacterium sp. TaxID=51671 RepID=UPI00391A92AB